MAARGLECTSPSEWKGRGRETAEFLVPAMGCRLAWWLGTGVAVSAPLRLSGERRDDETEAARRWQVKAGSVRPLTRYPLGGGLALAC